MEKLNLEDFQELNLGTCMVSDNLDNLLILIYTKYCYLKRLNLVLRQSEKITDKNRRNCISSIHHMFMELANGASMDVARAETSSFIHKHSNLLDHQVSSIFSGIREIPSRSDISLQIRPEQENSFKACICYHSNLIFETSLAEHLVRYPAGDLFNLLLRYGSLSPDTNFFWSIPQAIYSLIESVFAFDPLANFNSSLLGGLSSRRRSDSNWRRASDSSVSDNHLTSRAPRGVSSNSCAIMTNTNNSRRSSDSSYSSFDNSLDEQQNLRNYLIVEGFASPFNHNIDEYCSLFLEDKKCGSLGNFFTVMRTHKPPRPTVWICNPPFVLRIINKMEKAVKTRLVQYSDDIFFFMLPSWSGVPIYEYLEEYGVLEELEPDKYAVYDHSRSKYIRPPLNMKFGAIGGEKVDLQIIRTMMDSVLARFQNLAKIRKGRGRRRRRKKKFENDSTIFESIENRETNEDTSLPKISPWTTSFDNYSKDCSKDSASDEDAESETLSDTSEGIPISTICSD